MISGALSVTEKHFQDVQVQIIPLKYIFFKICIYLYILYL